MLASFFLGLAAAQTAALSNASVSGNFFFRHLQISTDSVGNIVEARTALGSITFDGRGGYVLNAQQTISNQGATILAGNGSYSVNAAGIMSIGNPQRNALFINARLGSEAIVGSTTESLDNTFDFFVAIPAPASAIGSSTFSGSYYVTSLEFPLTSGANVRSAFFSLTPSSNGVFSTVAGQGHALNVGSGTIGSLNLNGASYSLQSDGSGFASFGAVSNYLGGTKNLYVSASGNIILMGTVTAGAQDILIGVRASTATANVKNWTGQFFTSGLRYDGGYGSTRLSTTAAFVGGYNAIASLARLASYQRYHQFAASSVALTAFDSSGYQPLSLASTGAFVDGLNLAGLGTNGASFVETNVAGTTDNTGFAITFGIQTPTLSGSGVYINPQGVLNGATFATAGASIAPGEFVTVFGSGLAAAQVAASPPYPVLLGDVTATVNGIPAPLALVSANQVNLLVPYTVTGTSANIVVNNSGTASNTVTMPLAATAPGVFSQDSSGTGIGAILRANNTVVSTANPAKRGEVIQIYLTGLGAVTPAIPDGTAGTSSNKTVSPTAVYLNGQSAAVLYSGLAPGLPGLYQINVTIPANLVLGTSPAVLGIYSANAFTDTTDIPIQ